MQVIQPRRRNSIEILDKNMNDLVQSTSQPVNQSTSQPVNQSTSQEYCLLLRPIQIPQISGKPNS
jgi:hypothetical protein